MSLLVVELRGRDLRVEPRHDPPPLLIGDAAGAPIDDGALGIERAEVPPRGHVAGMQRHAETRGAQRPASQHEPEGVVAEQGEMPGTGARGDPGADGLEQPRDPSRGEVVEVRRRRVLELGALALVGHAAQSIDDDEEDPRTGAGGELGKLHRAMLSTRLRAIGQRTLEGGRSD